ncbi:putative ABC transport system ATP-binding protein [Thermoactinomyces sp. DSM 45891]|uniref:ABC transporter ATP-binding protein n=1 Tax=Thermoactinomyces sp. DSM 45891 TaxID=1761907 RepID=UPI00091487FB|nr:ABC transporter ATP-binding protein [Thermoactinomyces sp. DSM 45891]SFX70057.1 putative ABC transport system ATP-binding protein [Thermoactinomyces sp. DSM 45891]
MIQLTEVCKTYHSGKLHVPVLQNIDFYVNQGEYVAIMGPSGSGKSTLMNIIGCLDRPTSGSYQINGKEVSQMEDLELAKVRNRMIGFIFQQFQLLPRLSAQKNVELPLVYAGMSKSKRSSQAVEALRKVGLEDRKSHRPKELSGGQQQRVAIARALVNNPHVLLADEPTGALDTKSGQVILELFDELHQEGRTVVMITHDPEVARRAQRQIIIRDGEIIEDSMPSHGVGRGSL